LDRDIFAHYLGLVLGLGLEPLASRTSGLDLGLELSGLGLGLGPLASASRS